ncbi:MAG: HlyD family secretion protein [Devosia sp.]|nr:HlyD family secretion protein [Devosia sp.]
MNTRMKPPAQGEAEIVKLQPSAEAPKPAGPGTSPAPAAPASAAAPAAEPKKRGSGRIILMVGVPLILVLGGGYFWVTGGRYVDTDNAYVTQPIVSISPDVSGRVIEIDVKENQAVKKGDTLFKIDPAPFKIALDEANAALASARLSVEQLKVTYSTARTKLAADEQTLVIQQRTQARNTDLAGKGIATQTTVDEGQLTVQQAQQTVDVDKQSVAGALAALTGNAEIATDDHPDVKTAAASVENAKLNLARTTVVAPADGLVSQIPNFNVGQYVSSGTTIVSLVEVGRTWIEANFKETQLAEIKIGQPATVVVDAYGTKLVGRVESVQAATGAMFSLIPAQNATGNWVKVVQRVPVVISIQPNPDEPLRSGMSATATVDSGRSTWDKLTGH